MCFFLQVTFSYEFLDDAYELPRWVKNGESEKTLDYESLSFNNIYENVYFVRKICHLKILVVLSNKRKCIFSLAVYQTLL